MSSNGVLSFGNALLNFYPEKFPLRTSRTLIAPYWTDIDLSGNVGTVNYAVYTTDNGSSTIDQVNKFLANTESGMFEATTILVAQWIDVCPIHDYLCQDSVVS